MSARSTAVRFGSIAIANHWISALLIVIMIVLGFSHGLVGEEASKITILKFHAPIGIVILLLTIFRILWWIAFDKKPEPVAGTSRPMHIAAAAVHGLLYLLLLAMTISGIAMMVLSGAGEIIFGGAPGPLPDFHDYTPHLAHGLGAFILIALLVIHIIAAIYHQAILRDNLMSRMKFGG